MYNALEPISRPSRPIHLKADKEFDPGMVQVGKGVLISRMTSLRNGLPQKNKLYAFSCSTAQDKFGTFFLPSQVRNMPSFVFCSLPKVSGQLLNSHFVISCAMQRFLKDDLIAFTIVIGKVTNWPLRQKKFVELHES